MRGRIRFVASAGAERQVLYPPAARLVIITIGLVGFLARENMRVRKSLKSNSERRAVMIWKCEICGAVVPYNVPHKHEVVGGTSIYATYGCVYPGVTQGEPCASCELCIVKVQELEDTVKELGDKLDEIQRHIRQIIYR